MTDADHILDNATEIVALATDSPERIRAMKHVETCAKCKSGLRQAEELFELLAVSEPLVGPSAEVKRRVLDRIVGQMPTAPSESILTTVLPLIAAFLVLVIFSRERSDDAWIWAFLFLVGSLAISLWSRIRRFSWYPAIALLAGSAIVFLVIATGRSFFARLGVECLLVEQLGALFPLATTAYVAWRARTAIAPVRLVTSAMAGAFVGQAALQVTCPEHTALPHVLAFHTGGLLVAVLWGLLTFRVSSRLLATAS